MDLVGQENPFAQQKAINGLSEPLGLRYISTILKLISVLSTASPARSFLTALVLGILFISDKVSRPGSGQNLQPFSITKSMGDISPGVGGLQQDLQHTIHLPQNLESTAWTRFDEMVSSGKITYKDTSGETLEDEGFKVSYAQFSTVEQSAS